MEIRNTSVTIWNVTVECDFVCVCVGGGGGGGGVERGVSARRWGDEDPSGTKIFSIHILSSSREDGLIGDTERSQEQ